MATPTGGRTNGFAGFETKLIHAGEYEPRFGGAVSMPIFQSSTFEQPEPVDYHDIPYLRLSNTPNHRVLGWKLAALENAEAGLVAASGMAAISTTLLTVLSHGDHVLAQHRLYGGTFSLITKQLPRYGIEFDLVDGTDPADWERKLKPNTKALYVETIANPLIDVPELEAAVAFAREHGLVSLIDNTVASPANFRAAEFGFDISLHSATKFLNGHTDLVAGAVIGRADLVEEIRHSLNHLGGCLDVHACFLLHRGLKTLAVRMAHQNRSAQRLAEFLEGHAAVARVNYPGLKSHPSYDRAARWLAGCSGLMSFEVAGGVEHAERVIEHLRIPIQAVSLGGLETLVTRPTAHSHAGLAPAERDRMGLSDSLIRMSVGLETTDDLIEDLDRALTA